MAVCKKLLEKSVNSGECTYNGWLQDYVREQEIPDRAVREAFVRIAEQFPEVHICAGLCLPVSRESVANRIIRCGDILQTGERPVEVPYILYLERHGQQRALVVLPYSRYSPLYAKGLFYCLSEQGAEFESDRNELLTITCPGHKEIVYAIRALFEQKASVLQRRLDIRSFADYEAVFNDACEAAEKLCAGMAERLRTEGDPEQTVKDTILKWFLLKKLVYVQYMMSRDILYTVHNGDRKAQRTAARVRSERIRTIPYRKLCRMAREV